MDSSDTNRAVARVYMWWWLIFVVLIGIAVWCGWPTSYGYRFVSGLQPHAAPLVRPTSAQQLQAELNGALALRAGARAWLVGKQVLYHRIPVLAVMGNKGFWVGSGTGYRILVVGNESNTPSAYMTLAGVKDGDLVEVVGVVKQIPAAADAKVIFSLSESGAIALETEQVCVLASEIKVILDQ